MMLTEHNVWDDVSHNAMHSTSISTSIHQDISSNWLKTQRWRVTGCLNKNRGQFFGSEQEVKKKQMDLFMLTESISALFTRFIAKNNSWSQIKNIYILLHPTFRCSFLSVSSVRRICCSTCATNPVNMHLDLLTGVLKCSRWKISKLIVIDVIHCLLCLWIFTVDCTGQDLQSSLSKSGQNDLIDCGQHTRH